MTSRPDCLSQAQPVHLKPGDKVFGVGDPCQNFYYLLEGTIRVDLVARGGKSVLLYRFGANETCILTTSCLMAGEDYNAEAHVETDVQALALPHSTFLNLLNTSAEFRELVFNSFATRLAMMMSKIDEVAFQPLDSRLAARLLDLNSNADEIEITHEQLAADLGSAREVVSRRLAGWEKQGIISRERGALKIISHKGLEALKRLGD